ncbi:MAG: hypothetical protein ACXV5U_04705, partial [Ilumatobacteraceae bacterium]
AVVGPRVTHAEVAATAGVGIEDVAQIRAEATRDGLLRDSVGEQFAFDHELRRRALLDDVGAAVTAELQQRAADVIAGEATTADRLERIAALRLAAAGELGGATLDRAVAAARTAARALAGPYGHESAAPLLRSACTALERGGQEPAADLLIELGKAEYARGRLEVARTVFGHAIDRADDDPVEFAEAVLGLGLLTVFEHRTALDADRYRELLATATRRVPQAREDLRARLAIRQAVESWHDGIGPLDDVVAAAQLITSTAEASSAVDALSSVVHVLLGPHHAAQRASLIAELSEFAARSNDAFVALLATMWSTVHLVLTGAGEPQRTITELHQRADALRVRSVFYVAELMQSMLLLRRGQLDEAEKAMTANFERGIELGDADAFGYFAGQLMVLRWLQARTDEIVDVARQASVEPTVMAGDVVYRAAFAAIAADVGGDVEEEARRELDGIATSGLQHIPTGSNWLVSMASIVEAAARIHDAEVADEARRLLAPYRAFPIMGSLGSVCLGPVSRVLGLAAVTSGDREAGIEDLELAIADARRIGNRPFLAIARADLGTVLLADDRLDRRQRGRVLIEQAKAAMRSMGMARRADRLAEMHDRDTEDAPPCTLTRTDSSWEVVGLGQRAVVPDSRGMCYLGHLLANPGLDVGADELAGSRVGGDRQDIIDETARSVYGARIRELRAQLDDADIVGDAETSHKLQSELDALVAELAASTGLGRRTRTFIDDRERARTAVRKAIRRSVDRIAEQAPSLGMLLRATIVTGGVCRYEPADPERVSWIVRER